MVKCPYFIEDGLRFLGDAIEEIVGANPADNSGERFKNDVFEMNAYYWGDDEEFEGPNFSCDGFEVRWYKYLGRGMEVNQDISREDFASMMAKCLVSLEETKSHV